jgi:zinc and cadmium transporter
MTIVLYTLVSVIFVSLLSVLVGIPFFFRKKISDGTLIVLLSLSVGTLLGVTFLHLLPESFHDLDSSVAALLVIAGFLVFFVLEKLVHSHHNKNCESKPGHSHGYHLAPMNLIGDGVHNFTDGLIIAASYAVNTAAGIAATISIIFHELPQEFADFGVLLYSGWSKAKAMLFNWLSAATAVVGAVLGLLLVQSSDVVASMIVPFAAGGFIYIAASNLVPELHRRCGVSDTLSHLLAILVGVALIVVVGVFVPGGH